MIAKIALNVTFAIDKPYSYAVPEGMALVPGLRVQVPFGRGNRASEGIVLSLEPGDREGLKAVTCPLDHSPLLTQQMLRLAAFMRQRYFCSFYDAIRTMLPAGLWFTEQKTVTLVGNKPLPAQAPQEASAVWQLLMDLGGQAPKAVLQQALSQGEALEEALEYLKKKKLISLSADLHSRMTDKTEKIVTLVASQEEAMEFVNRRPRSGAMQKAVMELLCNLGSVSVKELCYYTGAKPATVKRLEALGYVALSERQVLRCRQIKPAQVTEPFALNPEQQAAFDILAPKMAEELPGSALLYGVTGSGKTAVYLRLIQKCLDEGKSALLLVPEIALTPQLLSLLAGCFGQEVAVLHSSLPAGERNDQWKRVQQGLSRVVVGTRSAVFAPCPQLGLVILDEEQEHSYKSENNPRYDARQIALWRGVKEKALVVLGSATPSIETMYRARRGDHLLVRLKNRFNGRALPTVELVDMGKEIRDGNDLSLSQELLLGIQDTREHGKQTILFLNRRGNARALVCVQCGKAPECPRCSARLTYHSANGRLMCHYCGHSQPAPKRCPHCDGQLKTAGVGTQRVQQELKNLFPDMEVSRMDADTVSAANTHETILEHFHKNKVPVLLGTQMVAKGLNLPNVTLVGVLDADLSLYSGSYRAAETTFNMLTQVVGRAGRGDAPGRALIQTLVPEHQVLKLAASQDYDGFYALEIQMRRILGNPPFGDLVEITITGQEELAVLHSGAKLRDSLIACLRGPDYCQYQASVLGPAPCVVPKINYNYRYRLTLRCRLDDKLRQLLASLLRQFAADKENRGVNAYVDVNGYD